MPLHVTKCFLWSDGFQVDKKETTAKGKEGPTGRPKDCHKEAQDEVRAQLADCGFVGAPIPQTVNEWGRSLDNLTQHVLGLAVVQGGQEFDSHVQKITCRIQRLFNRFF